jgi:hypothetical protein
MPIVGCSRRQALLGLGSLGFFGLSLADLLRTRTDAASPARHKGFGRARSCIVVLLKGGPSHLDMVDMKPEAPAEVRGPFRPIETNVAGIQVSEHLPLLARQIDKLTIVRTVSHGDGVHSTAAYQMTTGRPFPRPGESVSTRDDAPHWGAVAAAEGGAEAAAAPYVLVPDYLVVNGELRGGQNAGLLGSRYDPLVPGGGAGPGQLRLAQLGLAPNVPAARMSERARLLAAIEAAPHPAAEGAEVVEIYRQKALSLLRSEATRRALAVESQPQVVREHYGRCQFGESVLTARRLIEAGVRLVHVNCMSSVVELTRNWDTHKDNFNTLKNVLLPRTDRALAALLADLSASGLLDETLVVVMGEFGRTPRINPDAGRDHWPPAGFALLAGAGIAAGRTYGATDRHGAYPADSPVSPAQLAATVFHALGIDPRLELTTWSGRPYRICDVEPVLELWT